MPTNLNPGLIYEPFFGENPKLSHKYTLPSGGLAKVKTRAFQRKLSGVLAGKAPKKVTVWKNYVEFEYLPKSKFSTFRYVYAGSRGTLVNVGCPKGKWDKKHHVCKAGMKMHHVLVPLDRVLRLLASEMKPRRRKASKKRAANPVHYQTEVEVLYPGRRRWVSIDTIQGWASDVIADTEGKTIAPSKIPLAQALEILNDTGTVSTGRVEAKKYSYNKRKTKKAKNPLLMTIYGNPNDDQSFAAEVIGNPAENYSSRIKPMNFKKITVEQFERKYYPRLSPKEKKLYKLQKSRYKKAHLGAEPKHITRGVLKVGTRDTITDRDFFYDMGESPQEYYSVPSWSGKNKQSKHWVHTWKTKPKTLISSRGKTIIKPLTGTAKIEGGWMDG